MLSLQESERFTKGLLSWVGFTTKWIPYENVERTLGKTKWSFKSLFNYALNGYMSFAITPLRFAVWLGGLIDVATCIWAVYFIVSSILTANFGSGYATLLLFISFFGGTTILILGIIGEYLARVYLEVKRRPIYLLKETNINKEGLKDDND